MSRLRASLSDTPSRSMSLMVALGLAESGTEVAASWISGAFVQIARLWPLILLSKLCVISLLGIPLFRPDDAQQFGVLVVMLLVDGALMLVPRWPVFQERMPQKIYQLFCS